MPSVHLPMGQERAFGSAVGMGEQGPELELVVVVPELVVVVPELVVVVPVPPVLVPLDEEPLGPKLVVPAPVPVAAPAPVPPPLVLLAHALSTRAESVKGAAPFARRCQAAATAEG